jgi:hypothetical protein
MRKLNDQKGIRIRTHSALEIPYRTENDSRKLGIHCNVRVIVYNGPTPKGWPSWSRALGLRNIFPWLAMEIETRCKQFFGPVIWAEPVTQYIKPVVASGVCWELICRS